MQPARAPGVGRRVSFMNPIAQNDQLIAWLNDANLLERSLANVLENHAREAADFPELRAGIEAHLLETRRHAEQVEGCIRLLGGTLSTVKSVLGSAMGLVQGATMSVFPDRIVKNVLADFASEHLEIASYNSLVAAAASLGQSRIVQTRQTILREEYAMAEWLGAQIGFVTEAYLERQHTAA